MKVSPNNSGSEREEKFNLSFSPGDVISFLTSRTYRRKRKKSEQTRAWKQFQAAISKNDKSAVAAMIQFPFEASIISDDSLTKSKQKRILSKITREFLPLRDANKSLAGKSCRRPAKTNSILKCQKTAVIRFSLFAKSAARINLSARWQPGKK